MQSTVQFNGPLSFPAMTQNSYVMLPKPLNGNYNEMIVYALWNHTSDSGKVQIQTAPYFDYSGTWANVSTTLDWATIDTTGYKAITGIFGALRFTLTTAVTTGSVSLWVICSNVS